MIVVSTKENPKKEGQGFVRFDDDTEAWTPELAKVLPLVGKELPSDWILRDGPHGKQLLPPKEGPKTAYRNTKEGFLAESEGRLRWQRVEEERRDRRTSLMQAVALGQVAVTAAAEWQRVSDEMYAWLRQNVGEGQSPGSADPIASPSPATTSGSPPSASVPPGPTQQTAPEEAGAGDRKVTGKGQPTPAPATPEQWAQAVSIGLTEAKRNAVARSLGITANVTDMTGEQLDRIIAAYLEIQEKKKAS